MIATQTVLLSVLCLLDACNANVAFQTPSTSFLNGRTMASNHVSSSRNHRQVRVQMEVKSTMQRPSSSSEPMWHEYARNGQWNELLARCESHPEEAKHVYEHTGWTALQLLASRDGASMDVMDAVSEAYRTPQIDANVITVEPEAITVETEPMTIEPSAESDTLIDDTETVESVDADADDDDASNKFFFANSSEELETINKLKSQVVELTRSNDILMENINADKITIEELERDLSNALSKEKEEEENYLAQALLEEVDLVRTGLQDARRLLELTKEDHQAERNELNTLIEEKQELIVTMRQQLEDSEDKYAQISKSLEDVNAENDDLASSNQFLRSELNAKEMQDAQTMASEEANFELEEEINNLKLEKQGLLELLKVQSIKQDTRDAESNTSLERKLQEAREEVDSLNRMASESFSESAVDISPAIEAVTTDNLFAHYHTFSSSSAQP